MDGRDNLGRPVVVLNTGSLPKGASRNDLLEQVLMFLTPVVSQVSSGLAARSGGIVCE